MLDEVDDSKRKNLLKQFVSNDLPRENRDVIQFLMQFLNKVSQRFEKNKMSAGNLAIVWTPKDL